MAKGTYRVAVAAFALVAALLASPVASAQEVIRIGTLAPRTSPWGTILEKWSRIVHERSGGRLTVELWFNGQQGDEAAMVGKIKTGQLDGAALSATGLGKIYKPIIALQMPGLFKSWDGLDRAREAVRGELEKGARDAGFAILGWCDVGAVHLYSKGFQIRVPDDLRGKKPFSWRDGLIPPLLFQLVGGVTPVPLNVPEVITSLNTGATNVVAAPAVFAEQLQWSSKLDSVGADVAAYSVGALVVSDGRLAALPAELRQIVVDTAGTAAAQMRQKIRAEDDAALARQQGKMTVVTLSADDRAKWERLFKAVRARLADGVLDPALVEKLEALAR